MSYLTTVVLLLLVRFLAQGAAPKLRNLGRVRGAPRPKSADIARSWRTRAWAVIVGCSVVGSLLALRLEDRFSARTAGLALAVATPALLLAFAGYLLSALVATGRPRLLYWLAQALLIFPRTGETQAGATLWAALAVARRGSSTPEERAWLRECLSKESRALGTFGCACAVLRLLDARAARDEGRMAEANEAAMQARALLGTLTYASPAAVPPSVQRLTSDLLALLHASRGEWGMVATLPESRVSDRVVALRGYARPFFESHERSPEAERARRRVGSPLLDALFARSQVRKSYPIADVIARGRAAFLALSRHEPVSLNGQMMMLIAFDALMSPEYEGTAIPSEARGDEELVSAMQDDVAATLASLLAGNPPPIGGLKVFGPVSARVYHKVESALFEGLVRVAADLRERSKESLRYDAVREWIDASMARIALRRIEQGFGPTVAAQVWQEYGNAYCKLGVQLSETRPRRRPLAHAVFESLRIDAGRYGDQAQAKQQEHNTRVTSGIS